MNSNDVESIRKRLKRNPIQGRIVAYIDNADGLERVAKRSGDVSLFEAIEVDTDLVNMWDDNLDPFAYLFRVDEVGLWFHDGDGGWGSPIWRTSVVPWSRVRSFRLHLAS